MPPADPDAVIRRELAYHDDIYSGSAQEHFAKPGTRALRARMVSRMRTVLALGPSSRVLSLGCGIGDTELRLAPFVGEVVGIDLSPRGIDQARADAERLGIRNARFEVGSIDADLGRFDAVVAVFLLHHLPDEHLATLADHVAGALQPRGCFYSLDPNRRRASGWVGRKVVPGKMEQYQTEDERELDPAAVAALFPPPRWDTRVEWFDFGSTPVAGLVPSRAWPYHAAVGVDAVLRRVPGLRLLGSNFEVVARHAD